MESGAANDDHGERPSYRQLLESTDTPPGSSWAHFGRQDQIGTLNFLTQERLVSAARLVRRGAAFRLDCDLDTPSPPLFGRGAARHRVIRDEVSTEDILDNLSTQASSQWDALSHISHPEHGFYNGWSHSEVTGDAEGRLGIEHWAERGIAGRFALIDVARARFGNGRPLRMDRRDEVSADDLEAALERQRLELQPGSVVLIHLGWLSWFRAQTLERREELARAVPSADFTDDYERIFTAPGLACDESTLEWLWDREVAAVAADNPALEAMPFSRASTDSFLHYRLIPLLGMAVGELWNLGPLADDCEATGIYEGLLTAAPLFKRGGSGSPASALAFK